MRLLRTPAGISHPSHNRGQTMAEYALILAAVAIAAFVTYQFMGQDLNSMVSWKVDNYLTSAS
jgi:Flp pilus assembly pilin Flp